MRPYHTSHRRRGTVTVIVVAFLTLLLVLGLSFAFYALREAEESRVYRDSVRGGQTGVSPVLKSSSGIDDPPEPDSIANRILGDVIYGPPDDLTGAFNVLRQHEMSRSIYGWNPKFPSPHYPFDPTAFPIQPQFVASRAAIQPFNGLGRVSPATIGSACPVPANLPPNMINYSWITDSALQPHLAAITGGMMYDIDNNYQRDPRDPNALRTWIFNAPNIALPTYNPAPGGGDRYWAKNADYTYPDENNFFLAAIDPTTGRVLVQSYYRPWLINGNRPMNPEEETPPRNGLTTVPAAFNPADTNSWTNAVGRLHMLRPRPVDHQWPLGSGQSEWRYPNLNPDGTFGDVELLTGKSIGRQYDAQWLDPDLPVRTWRGKNYKPLIAMLILDLDSRINLNTAGNFFLVPGVVPPQFAHGSNQGVGPWEVNPSRVMLNYPPPVPNPMAPPALLYPPPVPDTNGAAALTLGTGATGAHGRYGATWIENQAPNPAPNPWRPLIAPLRLYGTHTGETTDPYGPQAIGRNKPAPGAGAHYYAGVDFLAGAGQGQYSSDDTQGHTTSYTWGHGVWGQAYTGVPGDPNNPPRPHDNNRYGNGYFVPHPNPTPALQPIYDERSHHPSLFNPYLVRSRSKINLNPGIPGDATNPMRVIPNRSFGVDEMRHLNTQFNYAVSRQSQLAMLAPNTLGNAAFRYDAANNGIQLNARFVTTTISNDFDLPGFGPANITPVPPMMMSNAPPTFRGNVIDPSNPPTPGTVGYDDSFRTNLNSLLGPVDLGRKLSEYRADVNSPLGYDRGMANGGPNVSPNVARAVTDRQRLAADIFQRLRVATGAVADPSIAPTAGDPTQRWLAQIAVNIVDFIDSDECITPFKWTDATGGGPGDDLNNEQFAMTTGQYQNANYRQLVQQNYVFGFERPRVGINEGYFRIENDPTDPLTNNQATLPYDMKMWLELHNPLTPSSQAEQFTGSEGYAPGLMDDQRHGGYRAPLKDTFQGAEKSIYRVLVTKIQGANQDPMGMRQANNVDGFPSTGVLPYSMMHPQAGQAQVLLFHQGDQSVADAGQMPQAVIPPNTGAQYKDQSFFLVGPNTDQQMGMGAAAVPAGGSTTANLTSHALSAKVELADFTIGPMGGQPNWSPGFVLQRLACPAMPPGQNNPYVTVDYFETTTAAVGHRVKYDQMGQGTGMEPDYNTTYAWGRRQPYDGVIKFDMMGQPRYRQEPQGVAMGQPNFTLGQHNGRTTMPAQPGANWDGGQTLQLPFRPLAHFDRNVLNPTELFHVVATRPHEFPYQFCGPPPGVDPADPNDGLTPPPYRRLKYTADWLDHGVAANQPGTYLYRALGLLRTGTPLHGLGMGGRVPGKININTIFNQEVFNAICDAQAGGPNRFQQGPMQPGTVDFAWNELMKARRDLGGNMFQGQDRPFRGFAVDTSFDRHRTLTTPDMLWSQSDVNQSSENYLPGPSPGGRASALEKYELISKVSKQFTTRSNSFAMYMMIGYFEVKNPGPWNETNRPILGKELGSDDGSITRHKYFAVIDRTNLTIEPTPLVTPGQAIPPIKQGQPPVYFSYQPNQLPPQPNVNVIEDPQPTTPPTAATVVRVPAIGQVLHPITGAPLPGLVSGQYDGVPWTIQAGVSQIVVDTGDRQELAIVQAVQFDLVGMTNSAELVLVQAPGSPNPGQPLEKLHSRGATMRLANPDPSQPPSTPGNPGPQAGFNYKSARYAPVIKYVEQLK